MLPQSMVQAGNRLNNYIADKTGLVGRLPEGGVDQQVRDAEKEYQARRAAGGESGFDGGRLAGNVFNPVNVAAASRIPQAVSTAGRVGVGAAAGLGSAIGLTPATSNDPFWQEKAMQGATGQATGGLFPLAAGGISRLISPNASVNPNLQLLKSEGVRPTVGQALGGVANTVEQKAQSVPILGDAISAARNRAREDFNKAAINRAVAPIVQQATSIGQQGVREAGDVLSQSYDDALAQIKAVPFDAGFRQQWNQLKGLANYLTPPMKAKFNREIQNLVEDRISPAGSMIGGAFKKAESELGLKAANFSSSSAAPVSRPGM